MVSFQINAPRWGGVSRRREYESPEILARGNVAICDQTVASHVNASGTGSDSWHKSDTASSRNVPAEGPEKENPGALAGATGAGYETEQLGKIDDLSAEYRWRHQCAITLTYALENAHPEDALTICCAALDQLRAGTPLPPLLEIEDEARWWASMAAPFELLAYMQACLDRLTDEAMKVNTRKRLMVQLWETLPATDRQAFLARVDPQGQFVRAGK
jgi:hypothetical protein